MLILMRISFVVISCVSVCICVWCLYFAFALYISVYLVLVLVLVVVVVVVCCVLCVYFWFFFVFSPLSLPFFTIDIKLQMMTAGDSRLALSDCVYLLVLQGPYRTHRVCIFWPLLFFCVVYVFDLHYSFYFCFFVNPFHPLVNLQQLQERRTALIRDLYARRYAHIPDTPPSNRRKNN
jgi:hypothetical protein